MKTNRKSFTREKLKEVILHGILAVIFILVFMCSFCSYGGWMSREELENVTSDVEDEVKYLESVKEYLKTEDGTYYELEKAENYKGSRINIKMDSEGTISYEIVNWFSYLHVQIFVSFALSLIVIIFVSSIIEDIVEDFFGRREKEKNREK